MNEETETTKNLLDDINIESTKERGGCLATFVIATVILNFFTMLYYFFAKNKLMETSKYFTSSWMIYFVSFFGLLNVIFGIAIWNWKKFGVYGLMVSALILFCFNIYIGMAAIASALGLIGPIILIILLKPVWSHLK